MNIPYDELLSKLEFGKNELDKRKNSLKGERADFIAYINGEAIEIEINCNDSINSSSLLYIFSINIPLFYILRS